MIRYIQSIALSTSYLYRITFSYLNEFLILYHSHYYYSIYNVCYKNDQLSNHYRYLIKNKSSMMDFDTDSSAEGIERTIL